MSGLAGQVIQVEATALEDKEQRVNIGLPDAPIEESWERILNCLHTLDKNIDMKNISIYLSSAGVRKQGTSYDAVLQAMNKVPINIPDKTCFIAEVTLNG